MITWKKSDSVRNKGVKYLVGNYYILIIGEKMQTLLKESSAASKWNYMQRRRSSLGNTDKKTSEICGVGEEEELRVER